METHLNHNNGSGNWIAFLFGAAFNTMAHLQETSATGYAVHAIIGGVICLGFKMLGDFLTPTLKQLGNKFRKWIAEEHDSGDYSKERES